MIDISRQPNELEMYIVPISLSKTTIYFIKQKITLRYFADCHVYRLLANRTKTI